jgi:hypothetical protein
MSTIVTSNVSDGTLSIPTTYVTNGSAKAWVNFDGTGTIAARDSLNLSSLTDNGTGDYTVNFTSAMANANYSTAGNIDGGTETSASPARSATFPQRLTTSVKVVGTVSTGSAVDWLYVTTTLDGDLA